MSLLILFIVEYLIRSLYDKVGPGPDNLPDFFLLKNIQYTYPFSALFLTKILKGVIFLACRETPSLSLHTEVVIIKSADITALVLYFPPISESLKDISTTG